MPHSGANASKAKIGRIARYAHGHEQVNSGALLAIDLDAETVETVEVSAASHVSPVYELSGEAPRVYGDARVTPRVWREWVRAIVEGEEC